MVKVINLEIFIKVLLLIFFRNQMMNLVHVGHDDRYRSKVSLSNPLPTPKIQWSRSRTSPFHAEGFLELIYSNYKMGLSYGLV